MGVAQFFEEELAGESVVVNFATTVVDGKYIGLIIISWVVKKLRNKWKKRKDYSKI